MREIKFRVWDIVSKKFLERVPILNLTIGHFSVNGYFFQQYTGLLDKNGKEIYEGDVCLEFGFDGQAVRRKEIKWETHNNVGAGFNHRDDGKYLEVMGNIYEHPELI